MDDFVTLLEISKLMGMDKSNARKYALHNGFVFSKVRTIETKGQLTLALSKEDTESLIELRRANGFIPNENIVIVESGIGVFYIISIIPELEENRIKLGFTSSIESRMATFKTVLPTAKIIKTWPCKVQWEQTVIDSITRIECNQVSREVFVCNHLNNLIDRADLFFDLMPNVK